MQVVQLLQVLADLDALQHLSLLLIHKALVLEQRSLTKELLSIGQLWIKKLLLLFLFNLEL